MVKEPPPKLTRFEVLGAWLNIWTPPRGAHVPPVPWRKLAIGAAAVLVVGGAAIAISAPLIDEAKDEAAARDQRGIEERRAARVARQRREQVAHTGRIPAGVNRGAAKVAVEVAIRDDARRRFDPRAKQPLCEVAPGHDVAADRVPFDCVSPVREIVGAADQEGARGTLGIPYRAVLEFDRRRYAFCKVNPPPGEQVIPDPRDIVELPAACRA